MCSGKSEKKKKNSHLTPGSENKGLQLMTDPWAMKANT